MCILTITAAFVGFGFRASGDRRDLDGAAGTLVDRARPDGLCVVAASHRANGCHACSSVSPASVQPSGFVYHGGYYLAFAAAGIGGLLVMACLRSARAQILFRESRTAMVQEKSETVSLLLREFEDSGADWLWQTDTSRCATHVSPRFAYALGEEAKDNRRPAAC